LREAIKQKTLTMNRAAVIGYCTMLEATLEHFYKVVWGDLLPAEKEKLVSIEKTFGKKNPADTLTLGGWLIFYANSDMSELLDKSGHVKRSAFNIADLSKVNEIRNRCIHESYAPTLEEVETVSRVVEKFLLETGTVKSIPKPFVTAASGGTAEQMRLDELGNKIRTILSNNPVATYRDTIEVEEGKLYAVDATLQFIGVCVEEDTIHVMALDKGSMIHEDVMDQVCEKLSERLWEPVTAASLDLKGVKVSVDIDDSYSNWGTVFEVGWEY